MGLVGIDIGFGDVKAVGENGAKLKFPTAVSYSQDGVCELGELTRERECHYAGRKYLVGAEALSTAFSTRSFDFLKRYAPLLAYEAVSRIRSSVSRISVGLPLAYYDKESKASLISSLRKIDVNRDTLELNVDVFPQGIGALLDYRLDSNGEEKKGTAIDGLVIDIGFNTVDIVAFENGSAVKADSGMMERAGISRIAQSLANSLQKETTINLTEQEAKEALLRKKISVYGFEKDLSELARHVVEDYVDWLLSAISSRWEDRIQRAQALILAGGGAYYIKPYIPAKYRDVLFVPDDPEFANARGFLKAIKTASRAV